MKKLAIAIVGGGTAGSSAALFLSRAGHEVTVFERVPEPGPVGAGIMMQPSGLGVLARLGCVEPILTRGARVERLVCQNERDVKVLDLAYERLAPGLFGIGLHRGVLFETLFGALRASSARVVLGVSIARVGASKRGRRVLVDDLGERHGPFDLVVVADGARSPTRDSMTEVAKTSVRYPWGAMWFIGEDRDRAYEGRLFQRVRGTRGMVGMLPSGLGPGEGATPLTSLFFSVKMDEVETWRTGGLDAWKAHVLSFAPEAAPLLDQITRLAQITIATYWNVTMPRWHAAGVVFLGDAAHATSPQLGQGCNLALVDAMTLAEVLADSGDVPSALDRYTALRRDHLAYYQLATRWLTPFFQSDHRALGPLRDLLMSKTKWSGFAEREMVRSMCGTKTGIFTGSFATKMP